MGAHPWHVDRLDLAGYLERLGGVARGPSRAALDELNEAHVRTLTFDNIDVTLEHATISSRPQASAWATMYVDGPRELLTDDVQMVGDGGKAPQWAGAIIGAESPRHGTGQARKGSPPTCRGWMGKRIGWRRIPRTVARRPAIYCTCHRVVEVNGNDR